MFRRDYSRNVIFTAFGGTCHFSDGSYLFCKFWLDGSTECEAVSPNGDFHHVTPPDGTGIAPPLIRPPSGLGIPGGSGGALDGGGTGNGGTMTFTGGQSGGGAAFLLTTPDGGGSGDGTAAPSDPTPPSGGTLPGSDHAPKPHKGHKHHGPKPGQVAPLAGKAQAAHHGKAKPAPHGKPKAK